LNVFLCLNLNETLAVVAGDVNAADAVAGGAFDFVAVAAAVESDAGCDARSDSVDYDADWASGWRHYFACSADLDY
jgi:hypothetical protein